MAEQDWVRIQRKTFTRWCNTHLAPEGMSIANLEDDISDGIILHRLVSILSNRFLAGLNKKPKTEFLKLENLNISLKALVNLEKIKLVNISAEDLLRKNSKLILGLIWTLILKYQIAVSQGGEGQSISKPRLALLHWVNDSLAPQGLSVNDFTSSWMDGSAFAGLVNVLEPDSVDISVPEDKGEAIKKMSDCFELAKDRWGIATLIDADDVVNSPEEQSLMSYVSLYRAMLHNQFPDPKYTRAEGDGLYGAFTNKDALVRVIAGNQNGPATMGGSSISTTITNPNGDITPIELHNKDSGIYEGVYNVSEPGKYIVDVCVSKVPIIDSPFSPEVRSVKGLDPKSIRAYGPGVEEGHPGPSNRFTVDPRETSSDPKLRAYLVDSQNQELPVNLSNNDDGTYAAEYGVQSLGPAKVHVDVEITPGEGIYEPITGSPFSIEVLLSPLDPDQTEVSGDGLGHVVAGECGIFKVIAKDFEGHPITSGGHPLNSAIDGPEQLSVDLIDNGDGTYDGSYTPTCAGIYSLDLKSNGKGVAQAPWKVNVVPGAPSAEHSEVEGKGLSAPKYHIPGPFKVQLRDRFGNAIDCGGAGVTASFISPNQTIDIPLEDKHDGTYEAEYPAVSKAGEFKLNVELDKIPIAGSPFLIPFKQHSSPCAQQCYLDDLGDGVAGEPQGPVVHILDDSGDAAEGDQKVVVSLDGPEHHSNPVVSEQPDGTYKCELAPTKAGDYKLNVSVNDKPISNSPFSFTVAPTVISPGHCYATGSGVTKANSNKPSKFKVHLCDCYDNKIKSNPGSVARADFVLLQIQQSSLSSEVDMKSDAPESGETEIQDLSVNVEDNGDGTFDAKYCLISSGKYQLNVFVDDQPIRDSPFTVDLRPGRVFTPNSIVRKPASNIAGKPGPRIILRDKNKNVRHKGGQDVRAQLKSKRAKPIQAKDNGDGSYTVDYPPDLSGDYDMQFYCGDEPLGDGVPLQVEPNRVSDEVLGQLQEVLPKSGHLLGQALERMSESDREVLVAELCALNIAGK